jgi:hypothetical protein
MVQINKLSSRTTRSDRSSLVETRTSLIAAHGLDHFRKLIAQLEHRTTQGRHSWKLESLMHMSLTKMPHSKFALTLLVAMHQALDTAVG